MLQDGLPQSLCTPNLHYLVCRAFKQEAAHGPLANNNELWVERVIKNEKAVTAGQVTKDPDRVLVSKRAMKESLAAISVAEKIRPPEEWSSPGSRCIL